MPPLRTTVPVKAVKTERTHEENQERAYIAASRRSDRSLEARVESARRASEIHKRRTGRSLRVTEQDVINEEMYEEEDDDLPVQYRRLAAHLQTGSADFNRRLQAYLTNQVAMRSALDQSINNAYAQQFPHAPQFASNLSMFPSPMLAHQAADPLVYTPNPVGPNPYRQAPYPPSAMAYGRSNRAASMSVALQQQQQIQIQQLQKQQQAAQAKAEAEPKHDRTKSMSAVPTTAAEEPVTEAPAPKPPVGSQMFSEAFKRRPVLNEQYAALYDAAINGTYTPLTTALPAETQGLLGSTIDRSTNLGALMMTNPVPDAAPPFEFNNTPSQTVSVNKGQTFPNYTSFMGMDSLGLDFDFSIDSTTSYFDQAIRAGETSTAGTPGINGESWANFIETDQWDMPASQQ